MRKGQVYGIFTILLLISLPVSILSKGSVDPKQSELQILVVFPPSQAEINEQVVSTKVNEALEKLKLSFPNQLNFTRIFPYNLTDGNKAIYSNANSGYDLIIGIMDGADDLGAYNYNIAFAVVSGENANQAMLLIDGIIFTNNGHGRSIIYREHEGSFLVGALAAMVSKSYKLGFYGGSEYRTYISTEVRYDSDFLNRHKFGFYQGANFIGDLIDVQYEFRASSPVFGDPYNETIAFIQDGVDVIYGVAGSDNFKIFEAVDDYNATRVDSKKEKVYAIGSNGDQDFIKPGLILTSMVKRIELALTSEISNLISGNWTPGEEHYGLEGGHLGISEMVFTLSEKLKEDDRFNNKARQELLQFLETSIVNDEIIISEDSTNTEINIVGENPFVEPDQSSLFEGNQFLVGAIIFALTAAIALFVLREQISRLIRKSDKSKAIDYLDKAKKIAEEPDE